MKDTAIIKRIAAVAALAAVVALSGCAALGNDWATTPPPQQKLPGDSLG